MTLYQNQNQLHQLQEDFLSDFDSRSSRKEEFSKKQSSRSFDEVANATEDAKPVEEDLKARMTSFDDDELDVSEELTGHSIWYVMQNMHVVIENAEDFCFSVVEEAQNMNFVDEFEAFMKFVENCVYSIPTYEEELKIVTAGCLFFYGGSWTVLASFLAAAELFDTKKELKAACEVGEKFMSIEDLDEEDDVTPSQLMETFKKVGLQFALMLAVLHSDAWAEICVSFAFASKLSTLVHFEELYDEPKDLSPADSEWLSLISSVSSTILSLIFYGIWPGLVVAMYMANIGLEYLLTVQYRFWLPIGDIVTFKELLTNPHNRIAIWISLTFTALWQGFYSYTGVSEFLSWLMFLLPAVQLFNLISGYFTIDLKSLKLQ